MMRRNPWIWLVASVAAEIALLAVAGLALWPQLLPDERAGLAALLARYPGIPLLAAVTQILLLAVLVHLLFSRYARPVAAMAEETRIIALSNPEHRLGRRRRQGLGDLVDDINLLAERYAAVHRDVELRISEAGAALEEERNTLAALMSHLTQGVLVCNREGRILLYNQRARALLEGSGAAAGQVSDWIGLGRSVHSVLDGQQIGHALLNIDHHLRKGETGLMAPFVISRPGGQLLNVHLMPVLDNDIDRNLRGYVLTLEDVTRRVGSESRRNVLVKALTEEQRSAIAGIRAAIETVLFYPEMDSARRYEFLEAIRGEALRVSAHLDRLEIEHGADLKLEGPVEEMLGSDLLAVIDRQVADTCGVTLEISAPVEPLWLRVDSYALSQCVRFLVEQLVDACRAERFRLALEHRRSLASLVLEWRGAPLHMDALKFWGTGRNVLPAWQGKPATLFDVIEGHGGAVWAHRTSASGCPSLRLILPVSEQDPSHTDPRVTTPTLQSFDFDLFRVSVKPDEVDRQPLAKLSCTVIDTETTGLQPSEGDEIIAIGAVRIINGRILYQEVFDCLVNPRRPIAETAQQVHGITGDMVRGMPTIEETLPRLRRFVEDTVLIGHNVAFDMRFLELKEAATGIRFRNPVLDTMLLASLVHAEQEDNSLEAIAARFGITVTGRHTALGDALTTAGVFLAMVPLLAERGIRTVREAQEACSHTEHARLTY